MKRIISLFLIICGLFILASCKDGKVDVSFNKNILSLNVGDEYSLVDNKNFKETTFLSFDDSIASIDNLGVVKAKSSGKTTVCAISGENLIKCEIKVNEKEIPISTTKKDGTLKLILLNDDMTFYAPISIKYHNKNSLLSLDNNIKLEFLLDITKGLELAGVKDYEQVKKNLVILNLLSQFISKVPVEVKSDIQSLNESLSNLSGDELKNKVSSLEEKNIYAYMDYNYNALGYMKKDSAIAYKYESKENELLAKLSNILNIINGIGLNVENFEKVNYINLLNTINDELLSADRSAKLSKYKDTVNLISSLILGGITINKVKEDNKHLSININFTTDGLKLISERIKTINPLLNSLEFSEFKITIKFYNDNNNYTHFKALSINGKSTNNLILSLDLNLNEEGVSLNDDSYLYYINKEKYEKGSA